jgi:hypothetical protein
MTTVLVELYQQKLELFQHLGKLSALMAEFAPSQLVGDDAAGERFFQLLDQRTVLIGKIDELTEEIESRESQDDKEEVGILKRALQEEMVRLQSTNEVVETLVKRSLDQLREEAKKLQSGKQSNRAYVGNIPSAEGSFIDKRR